MAKVKGAGELPAYGNLQTATRDLFAALEGGETVKLSAARIVQAIKNQELYRELGFATFSAYLPELLRITASVGWGAARTVRSYLAFVEVYLDELGLDAEEAMQGVTHLHLLLRLADRDRETGALKPDTEKQGKLGAVAFEAVTKVTNWLVNAPSEAQRTGLSIENTRAALLKAGLDEAASIYETVSGNPALLPPGGVAVEDTKLLVQLLTGKEEKEKLTRLWVVANDGFTVVLSALEFYAGEELREKLDLGGKVIEAEEFEKIVGKDKVMNKEEKV